MKVILTFLSSLLGYLLAFSNPALEIYHERSGRVMICWGFGLCLWETKFVGIRIRDLRRAFCAVWAWICFPHFLALILSVKSFQLLTWWCIRIRG